LASLKPPLPTESAPVVKAPPPPPTEEVLATAAKLKANLAQLKSFYCGSATSSSSASQKPKDMSKLDSLGEDTIVVGKRY